MADDIENPEHAAELRKVRRGLDDLQQEFKEELSGLKEDIRRRPPRAAPTPGTGTTGRTPAAPPTGPAAIREIQDSAAAARRAAAAYDNLNSAQAERLRLQRALRAQGGIAAAAEAVQVANINAAASALRGAPAPTAPAGPTAGAAEGVQAAVRRAEAARMLADETERAAAAEADWRTQQARAARSPWSQTGKSQYPQPAGPPRPMVDMGRVLSQEEEAVRLADEHRRATIARHAAVEDYTGALGRSARAAAMASDEYTRHGYLTSEFISAAARGQVTAGQMATQIGGTIGKFAGWTAAATAVYGVAAAFGQVYQGALQAASGVDLVGRVAEDMSSSQRSGLQTRFRDMAQQFNLPVEDVVQAVYGGVKVSAGDLDEGMRIAEQALFGVKVGELSAAESTEYLNSIMKGLGITASELPPVFDTINEATNRFGGSTGDLIGGVARSIGVFKLAGGSYQELIALLQTGSRLTGVTSREVATAVNRAASSVLTPQGAARARAQGLDPNQSFSALIAQASELAQGASPEQVNALARALVPAGGQYARIFAPILQNRQEYERILGSLSQDQVRGSAGEELRQVRAQANEELKQIGVNLQAIGAALAQSGGLNLLVGMVKLLNTGLELTEEVIGAFNRLISIVPEPFRSALVPLAQMALIMRGLRRFDLGGSLPAGREGGMYEAVRGRLEREPANLANAQILRGMEDERQAIQQRRREVSSQAMWAGYEEEKNRNRLGIAARELQAVEGLDPKDQQRLDAQRKYDRALDRHTRSWERAQDLIESSDDLGERMALNQTQIDDYRKGRKEGLAPETAAARAGIAYTVPTLERPTALGPERIGSADEAQRAAEASRQAQYAQREATRMGRAANRLADAGGRFSIAAAPVAAALARVPTAVAGVRGGMDRMRARLGNLATTGIGGLDGAIIGLLAAFEAYRMASAAADARDERIQRITAVDPRRARATVQATLAQRDAREADLGPFGTITNPGAYISQSLQTTQRVGQRVFSRVFNALTPGAATGVQGDIEEASAEAARRYAESIAEAQRKGVMLYDEQIRDNFQRAMAGAETGAEIDSAIAEMQRQINQGFSTVQGDKRAQEAARKAKQTMIASALAYRAALGDMGAALQGIENLDQVNAFIQGVQANFALQGNSRSNRRALGGAVVSAVGQYALDINQRVDAAARIGQATDALMGEVERTMTRNLSRARTPRGRAAARNTAVEQFREGLIGPLEQEIARLQGNIPKTLDEINRLSAQAGGGARASWSPGLTNMRNVLESQRKRLRALRDQLGLSEEQVADLERQMQRQNFEDTQALFAARTGAQAARLVDPVARLEFELDRGNSQLGAIAREYGRESTEYLSAIQRSREQRQQLVEAQIDRFSLARDVQRSRANIGATQGAQLQGAVADAEALLGQVQGANVSPERLAQAQITLNDARGALVEYQRQEAQSLVEALGALAESRTNDPLRQAGIQTRTAERLVQFARTPAERAQALAQVNNARENERSMRFSSREEDISFDLDMERIDRETAIARYRNLLKAKNITREEKRRIMRTIKGLQDSTDDSDLNLDVGSIRLPSVYEIRRAAGVNARGVSVTNQNRATVIVNSGEDVPAVMRVMEDHNDGIGRAYARAAMR